MKTALVNGKIYVERGVFQSAAAMENGIITAVGTDEEILAHAGKDARIIDCEGRTGDDERAKHTRDRAPEDVTGTQCGAPPKARYQ